jgi:hypothetical protein
MRAPSIFMEATPGTILFILADTIGIFSGMPVCSHIGDARQTTSYISAD